MRIELSMLKQWQLHLIVINYSIVSSHNTHTHTHTETKVADHGKEQCVASEQSTSAVPSGGHGVVVAVYVNTEVRGEDGGGDRERNGEREER